MTTHDRPPPATLATALASAAASAPNIVGLALAASVVGFNEILWSVVAGFAAGAVLRRGNRRLAAVVTTAAVAWFAVLAFLVVSGPSENHGSPRQIAAAGVGVVAFIVGRRPRGFVGVAFSIAFVAQTAILLVAFDLALADTLYGDSGHLSDLALGGGAILAAALRARRRRFSAALTLVVALAQHFAVLRGRALDPAAVVFVASMLGLAYIAGALACALDDGVPADPSTRLVVVAQRHAWITSAVVAGVASFVSRAAVAHLRWIFGDDRILKSDFFWGAQSDYLDGDRLALFIAMSMGSFLAHAGRGGRSKWDRFAPWLAANVAALASALLGGAAHMAAEVALGITTVLALWPLICAAPAAAFTSRRTSAVVGTSIAVLVVATPTLVGSVTHTVGGWRATSFICLAFVPVAFHALVASDIPTRVILACSLALGFAATLAYRSFVDEGGLAIAWPAPPAWLFAALLVVAARRCRSMTAVPRDHPLVEDFGGA